MTDTPLNALETVIRDGQAGKATPADLHAALLGATLYVPSASEIEQDPSAARYVPLILQTPSSEVGMILAFTDPSRITPEARERAPYVFEVAGSRLVATLMSDCGLMVLAGPDAAVELDPATLYDLKLSMLG